MAFLVLHVLGLGAAIVVSVVYGAWDLVLVNSLVFLVLVRLEMVLVGKRYTIPMPVSTSTPASPVFEKREEMQAVTPQAEEMQAATPQTEASQPKTPVKELLIAAA